MVRQFLKLPYIKIPDFLYNFRYNFGHAGSNMFNSARAAAKIIFPRERARMLQTI